MCRHPGAFSIDDRFRAGFLRRVATSTRQLTLRPLTPWLRLRLRDSALSYLLREKCLSGETIMSILDHYEFLQISPNAEPDTIHRVYRFLAGRLHPDNPETGDPEKFFLLKQAYDVLSDPERRAEYDATCQKQAPQPVPLSTSIDFLDSLEGELNRRLVLLALLYIQRRTNPYTPEVSLFEVERRMGIPRDYLEFTTWYLKNKGYVTRADNADFNLTVEGVDFVESQRVNIPVLNELLTSGTGPSSTDGVAASKALISAPTPIKVPTGQGASEGIGANGDKEV
jgi:curved DNA-binding protein